jgi:hypothetical protein
MAWIPVERLRPSRRALPWLAGALVAAAALVLSASAASPVERLWGGYVRCGGSECWMEGWGLDARDGSVSGTVLQRDDGGISSVEEARLSLLLMDEVTEDLEPVRVEWPATIDADGKTARWRVERFVVPAGKRMRGIALDGSLTDAKGERHALGGAMGIAGPSWAEQRRLARLVGDLLVRGRCAAEQALMLLETGDALERAAAARVLGALVKDPERAVAALLARLEVERYTLVKEAIVYALGDYVVAGASAVPRLRALVADAAERDGLRRAALGSLADLGPVAHGAVPELAAQVRGGNVLHRMLAIHALGRIGPAARSTRPAIRAVLDATSDGNTRKAALEALARIGE